MEDIKRLLDKLGVNYTVWLEHKVEGIETLNFSIYNTFGELQDGRTKMAKKLLELLKLEYKENFYIHIYRGEFNILTRQSK